MSNECPVQKIEYMYNEHHLFHSTRDLHDALPTPPLLRTSSKSALLSRLLLCGLAGAHSNSPSQKVLKHNRIRHTDE